MPTGGLLTLETVPVHLDRTSPALEGMEPGDYTMLAVSDTGVGMDPDVQRQIFDPFFTTKDTGEGTGLGLAVVHGIVRRSGGRISAYSEAGHGSVFKVYFPRVDTPTGDAPDDAFDLAGQGYILAVEDDPAVRNVLVSMLTSIGLRRHRCRRCRAGRIPADRPTRPRDHRCHDAGHHRTGPR